MIPFKKYIKNQTSNLANEMVFDDNRLDNFISYYLCYRNLLHNLLLNKILFNKIKRFGS